MACDDAKIIPINVSGPNYASFEEKICRNDIDDDASKKYDKKSQMRRHMLTFKQYFFVKRKRSRFDWMKIFCFVLCMVLLVFVRGTEECSISGVLGTFYVRPTVVQLENMNWESIDSNDMSFEPLYSYSLRPPQYILPMTLNSIEAEMSVGKYEIELTEDEIRNIYHPWDSDDEREYQKNILPWFYSEDAMVGRRDPFVEGDCVQLADWQLHPGYFTCNLIHEYELADMAGVEKSREVSLINHGYWRDVWKMTDDRLERFVLKNQRYDHG